MQYRYRPRYRPPRFATLPPGLVWEFVEMPPDIAHRRPEVPRSAHRFGVVATARALTDEELERFELDVHESASAGNELALQAPVVDATTRVDRRGLRPMSANLKPHAQ